jgi:nicotinate-nucleotide adenylyltransferase
LICARAVAEAAGFEQVVLIPSAQPPHKPGDRTLASALHRLTMCHIAVEQDPFFGVVDLELKRRGPSYTIDTVRELKANGWDEVSWLIGADMVAILPQWHEPLALLNEANLVVMARPGWTLDWQMLPPPYQRLRERVITAPLIEISGSAVRRRVAAGQSVRWMVDDRVEQYIASHKLYDGGRQ